MFRPKRKRKTQNLSRAAQQTQMDKFQAAQGHGYAAEQANNLYDFLTGKDAKIVGTSQPETSVALDAAGFSASAETSATFTRASDTISSCCSLMVETTSAGAFTVMASSCFGEMP